MNTQATIRSCHVGKMLSPDNLFQLSLRLDKEHNTNSGDTHFIPTHFLACVAGRTKVSAEVDPSTRKCANLREYWDMLLHHDVFFPELHFSEGESESQEQYRELV